MSHNYVPNPPFTAAGQPPQPGQATVYETKQGDEYPGMIYGVSGILPNGNYQVMVHILKPSASQLAADPKLLGNPTAEERNGWQYNVKEGRVYFCPCVPPDPNATCP